MILIWHGLVFKDRLPSNWLRDLKIIFQRKGRGEQRAV